jgi:hypothetical protein
VFLSGARSSPARPALTGAGQGGGDRRALDQGGAALDLAPAVLLNPFGETGDGKMGVPYAGSTTGTKARAEISRMLEAFGCESVGFMDDFAAGELLLAFKHRGRAVQLRASAKGWAALYLKQNPYTSARRLTRVDYEQAALRQGLIAINSILRDWVKGQITAIETGILSFEGVFMPYMLTRDGRPVIERIQAENLLAPPT